MEIIVSRTKLLTEHSSCREEIPKRSKLAWIGDSPAHLYISGCDPINPEGSVIVTSVHPQSKFYREETPPLFIRSKKAIQPAIAWQDFSVDMSKPFIVQTKHVTTLNIEPMSEDLTYGETYVQGVKQINMKKFIEEMEIKFDEFIDASDTPIEKNLRVRVKDDFLEFLNPTIDPNQTELFDENNG